MKKHINHETHETHENSKRISFVFFVCFVVKNPWIIPRGFSYAWAKRLCLKDGKWTLAKVSRTQGLTGAIGFSWRAWRLGESEDPMRW